MYKLLCVLACTCAEDNIILLIWFAVRKEWKGVRVCACMCSWVYLRRQVADVGTWVSTVYELCVCFYLSIISLYLFRCLPSSTRLFIAPFPYMLTTRTRLCPCCCWVSVAFISCNKLLWYCSHELVNIKINPTEGSTIMEKKTWGVTYIFSLWQLKGYWVRRGEGSYPSEKKLSKKMYKRINE